MSKEIFSTTKVRFSDCDPIGHLNNIQYLKYFQDAREDHLEEKFNFSYQKHALNTGYTWITIKNEIAYLKEIKAYEKIKISSKTILVKDRTSVVELLMYSEDMKTIYSVLWMELIYFNLKTRKSETQGQDVIDFFADNFQEIEQKNFDERINYLRLWNKENSK